MGVEGCGVQNQDYARVPGLLSKCSSIMEFPTERGMSAGCEVASTTRSKGARIYGKDNAMNGVT